MKKIILLFILLFSFFTMEVIAQAMVVTDPTNLAQIKELVKTGSEQTAKINKQVEFLKDAKDNLEIVSSYLKRAKTVEKAITQSQITLKNLNEVTRKVNNLGNLSTTYVTEITKSFKKHYDILNEAVLEITSCLSDGQYKMSDSDRLKHVNEQLDKIEYTNRMINKTYKDAQRINNRKAMLGGK